MKLPGLAFALLALALPACTCSRSDAPAPAPAPVETAQAAVEAAPASSAPNRLMLKRIDKNQKRPLMERMESIRPLLTDGGAPAPSKAKLNCGPSSVKAVKAAKAEPAAP